eukprot:CAMPEP_0176363458 /NCGR_PEP_ID=MMETSP0126-20121128/19124_1 /TAXON_ID=141414 ORGANISM="Strombidinopsis acuminatum, Strain SPMC142" /NCGR_SAMPLE_ID=MMETSP0126 /ASSEMBLY_ACC=CAM_ASM_000229 /LENGTH=194 /DNA_ID=CAMNT_0017719747 /DNA_START=148 /DNA_END=732 /DNA_ORIENTATION=-
MTAFRGFWSGFNKGLYKKNHTAMTAECMNDETIQNSMDIADYLFSSSDEETEAEEGALKQEQENNGDMFSIMGKAANVFSNLNACNFRQPYRDIGEFCGSDDDVEQEAMTLKSSKKVKDLEIDDIEIEENSLCTMGDMMDNVTKNMFALMGKFSSFAELMKVFPAESDDELKQQTLEMGEDFGTFMKTALNFTQ